MMVWLIYINYTNYRLKDDCMTLGSSSHNMCATMRSAINSCAEVHGMKQPLCANANNCPVIRSSVVLPEVFGPVIINIRHGCTFVLTSSLLSLFSFSFSIYLFSFASIDLHHIIVFGTQPAEYTPLPDLHQSLLLLKVQ